ncbi:(deoxy)nucleoside triphosphate pyrophosphohydrolase [Nocardia sp. 348MFTsu5.1]|uniref:(deoxy)nucleoside triphosphate pyrophosphohydrolase n=1 Tax=Nocardia sp. 348MFTsu5.1 TaxID=1172185 RepID=UPI0003779116|nr:NUDIX domain-containing protein [Nocardia sp. 348MFTsu5.1]
MREVVAGAVIAGGRLLLAQRTYPADVAGLWELPGGKVEEGETRARALERELVEELGITVAVTDQIGPPVPLRPDLALVAMAATLIAGEPHPHEHSAVRWVDADDLRRMTEAGELVPADAIWLDDLIALL